MKKKMKIDKTIQKAFQSAGFYAKEKRNSPKKAWTKIEFGGLTIIFDPPYIGDLQFKEELKKRK